jgi:hypothetical protein
MKVFNVVCHHYIDYEENSNTIVIVCDTLEKAKEHAIDLYKKEYNKSNINNSLHSYYFFESVLDIFKRPSKYAKNYVTSFYVIESELNIPISYNEENIIWSISEKDVFNFFTQDINSIFKKDFIEPLDNIEIKELFHKFKIDRRNFSENFNRKNGYKNKSAFDFISMTNLNKNDIFLYEKYEKYEKY